MNIHKSLKSKISLLLVLTMMFVNVAVVNAADYKWEEDIYLDFDYSSPYYDGDIVVGFIEAAAEWNTVLNEANAGFEINIANSAGQENVDIYFRNYIGGALANTDMTYGTIGGKQIISGNIYVDVGEIHQYGYSGTKLKAMAMHELGHVLLGESYHSTESDSIMRQGFSEIWNMTKPGQSDIDKIKSIY